MQHVPVKSFSLADIPDSLVGKKRTSKGDVEDTSFLAEAVIDIRLVDNQVNIGDGRYSSLVNPWVESSQGQSTIG